MADIHKLAANPSAEARAGIAGKVAATLSVGVFTARESTLALEILRVLSRDTEVRVRASIAFNLRHSHTAPPDLVRALAEDIPEVSMPLLALSEVLSEDDLVAIVRATREVAKLMAIAGRQSISSPLAEALLETEIQEVMKAVLANHGAVIRDAQLLSRWELIAGSQSLLEVLVMRGGLSMTVAEKLYASVGDALKPQLAKQYHLPMVVVDEAAEDAREWATLGMTTPDGEPRHYSEAELEELVGQLYLNNRLTYSLVMRSLCIGDMGFFEAAVARLAGVPRVNARILMFDSGMLGFKAIYEKARMPEGFYDAIHTLLRLSLEETGYGRLRREDFRQRVIARVQSAGYDRSIENMQYLLTIIGGKIAAAQTLH